MAAIHDLNIAAMYCDHIIAMKDGEILRQGTPKEVLTSDFIYQMFEVQADVIERADGRLVVVYEN